MDRNNMTAIRGQTKGQLKPASSTLAHWTTVQLCHRRISVNTLHEGCCYSHLEEHGCRPGGGMFSEVVFEAELRVQLDQLTYNYCLES